MQVDYDKLLDRNIPYNTLGDGLLVLGPGALHLWEREDGQHHKGWVPRHALSGHYGEVVDLRWALDGSCLVTVSTDQTARISTIMDGHWCEMARPQV